MAKNQQQIVQPQSLLSRLLWRGALVLVALCLFAAFVDHVVLPKDSGKFTAEVLKIKKFARGALADAAEKTHAKIWK